MIKRQLGFIVIMATCLITNAQTKTAADQVVEGGKVLVELIKVFSNDREKNEANGCKGKHADLCIANARDTSLTVAIAHRLTEEQRELVIVYGSKECCLQLPVGVWTYDLRLTGSMNSERKGDILIEGCNNLTMTIK